MVKLGLKPKHGSMILTLNNETILKLNLILYSGILKKEEEVIKSTLLRQKLPDLGSNLVLTHSIASICSTAFHGGP